MKGLFFFLWAVSTEAFSNPNSLSSSISKSRCLLSATEENQWFDSRHRTRQSQGGYGGTAPGSPDGWWGNAVIRSSDKTISPVRTADQTEMYESKEWEREMGEWFSRYLEETGYNDQDTKQIKRLIAKTLSKVDQDNTEQTNNARISEANKANDSESTSETKPKGQPKSSDPFSFTYVYNEVTGKYIKGPEADSQRKAETSSFREKRMKVMEAAKEMGMNTVRQPPTLSFSGSCPGAPGGLHWAESSVTPIDKTNQASSARTTSNYPQQPNASTEDSSRAVANAQPAVCPGNPNHWAETSVTPIERPSSRSRDASARTTSNYPQQSQASAEISVNTIVNANTAVCPGNPNHWAETSVTTFEERSTNPNVLKGESCPGTFDHWAEDSVSASNGMNDSR